MSRTFDETVTRLIFNEALSRHRLRNGSAIFDSCDAKRIILREERNQMGKSNTGISYIFLVDIHHNALKYMNMVKYFYCTVTRMRIFVHRGEQLYCEHPPPADSQVSCRLNSHRFSHCFYDKLPPRIK